MGAVTFLVGGARSGKSTLAVEIGRRHDAQPPLGNVVFVATAEPFDDDLRTRVARHRHDRPAWPTVEAPVELAAAVAGIDGETLVIIDCVTVWVNNLLHRGDATHDVLCRTSDLLDRLRDRNGPSVVVSNEVGMGVHPSSELGREYRDVLGSVNQAIARAADRTLLLVTGRALELLDPLDAL